MAAEGEREKERRKSRDGERERTVGLGSSEESDMEMDDGTRGLGKKDQTRNEQKKVRSPREKSPLGKC
jgi:hypothetical protein